MPADKIAKLVGHLKTPEDCEQVALNVEAREPAFAIAARRKAVELKAATHNAATEAEKQALQAVYAYERVLTVERGKKTRASRTWQMITRLGIVEAVESIVKRPTEKAGYQALVKMGMQDMLFEAVVVRHPEVFSAEAVSQAKQRLEELTSSNQG
jgi:NAD(P)H-nitrite reductase large subunit